jgi:hypothetical protein
MFVKGIRTPGRKDGSQTSSIRELGRDVEDEFEI